MIIRAYQQTDSYEVFQLFQNTIRVTNSPDYSSAEIEAWISCTNEISLNERLLNSYTLVAVKDNKIIGYGSIQKNILDHLYIHHNYVHQGVATKLCDLLEKQTQLPILVHASITAKSFFEKRGYHTLNKRDNFINNQLLINYEMQK